MKLKYYIYSLMASVMLLLAACSPEEFDLGAKNVQPEDLVQGLAFTVTPDATNPNVIKLKNNMAGYTALWEHPQGRSQADEVTLNLAFPGSYTVKYGVETRGGVVYGEPYTFEVTTTCLAFVEDELWTNLTGGVGNSKTWIPGDYGYEGCNTTGELAYADPTTELEFGNWASNWDPGKGVTGDEGIFTSSMTFSLSAEEGTKVSIVNNTAGAVAEQSGTYMLDKDAHTLSFTDCSILHTQGWDYKASNWRRNLKVLTLTENFLQVAIWRDTSDEGEWWMVLNFVAKDFADNYVREEPEPALPNGWKDNVEQNAVVTTKITWVLSEQNPLDWADLTGAMMNKWATPSDYPDWLGTPDPASYADFSLALESSDHTYTCTTPDGTTVSGEYTLDEKGIYTFSNGLPSATIVGWASFGTTAENQLRILQIETDALGKVSGMWLGQRDPEKAEYTAYHMIAKVEGGGIVDLLAAWKSALCGKTFVPDVNYFADWVTKTWTGGWTSSIYPTDFETQGWFWTEEIYNACLASSVTFYEDGDGIKADAVDNGVSKTGIVVTIDTDAATITYSEAPFTFSFIYTNNNNGLGPWLFGGYGGASLGNVNTKGIYTGFVSNDDEITMNHMVLKVD